MHIPRDLQGVGPATLNDLTKTELQAHCDRRGIYYAKSWTKGELVDALLKWKRNPSASPWKASTKKKRSREYICSEDEDSDDEDDCKPIKKKTSKGKRQRKIYSSSEDVSDEEPIMKFSRNSSKQIALANKSQLTTTQLKTLMRDLPALNSTAFQQLVATSPIRSIIKKDNKPKVVFFASNQEDADAATEAVSKTVKYERRQRGYW